MTARIALIAFGLVIASAALAACASTPAGGEAVVRAVPFAAGERLVYSLHNLAGSEVARGTLSVRGGSEAGTFVLVQQYEEAGGAPSAAPASDTTSVTVDAATLLPRALERTVQGPEPLQLSAAPAPDGSGLVVTRDAGNPRTIRLGPNAYANESALWVWRTLPLAEDYVQRYVSVDATEGAVALVSVTVKARERVEVPAGAFDTWRLLVRGGRATGVAWVNVEAPHQVVQWDNGAVIFRLEAVR